jgi:hypothetical protein
VPLPTLEELRAILKSYEDPVPSNPLEKLSCADVRRYTKRLSIKKDQLHPIAVFYKNYSGKVGMIRSKFSQENVRIIGNELYRVTSIIFNDPEIVEFNRKVEHIVDYSIKKYHRVLFEWNSIGAYWRRMDRLFDFFELHSENCREFSDSRDYHVMQLKTDLIKAYLFMKRRGKST